MKVHATVEISDEKIMEMLELVRKGVPVYTAMDKLFDRIITSVGVSFSAELMALLKQEIRNESKDQLQEEESAEKVISDWTNKWHGLNEKFDLPPKVKAAMEVIERRKDNQDL